jgi:RNA polymerase sigma factor (sigma-70 family)
MSVTEGELKLAEKVAAKMASRWQVVETEELTSHLYLWLMENLTALKRWRGEDGGEGKLFVSLRREASKFCVTETEHRINRRINDNPAYPVDMLERALPFLFEEVGFSSVPVNPVTEQPTQVANNVGLAQAILADLRAAYYGMPLEVREVIAWRFRDGLTYEEIGELSNLTKDGAKKRVQRALRRLSEYLGSESEWD